MQRLSGWGRYPQIEAHERRSEDLARICEGVVLTRGLGRSYGDASLPPAGGHTVAASPLADRILEYSPASGVLRAEAGLSLEALNRSFLPRGCVVPVSPGTQHVTLGGMVAADVHGKNHHVDGCFGEHVRKLVMRMPDGRILEASENHERELFHATLGGMGLTGHILEVEFRMKPVPSPWIRTETEPIADLETLAPRLCKAGETWPYTVAWVDCLGRGASYGRSVLIKGRWADGGDLPGRTPQPTIPRRRPRPLRLQAWFVRLFNALHHWRHKAQRSALESPYEFFYPLDGVRDWNRFYGKRGFTQYQCVLPEETALPRFFELLRRERIRPFLCVVKDCGAQGLGMLSFPRPGVTVAMDLPMHSTIQREVDLMNERVIEEGGRIYLAKDALTRAEHFRAMEPRLDAWSRVRLKWDPERTLRSAQSVRLLGDPA